MCRGIEVVRFEENRIFEPVTQDEALSILLESDLAQKYRAIGRVSVKRQKL